MLKRFLYAGVFAVVCLGLVTLFLIKHFEKVTPVEVLQAIPGDAVLFAENIDYEYLTESFLPNSGMWIDFLNNAGKGDLDSLINLTLGQIRSSESLDPRRQEGVVLQQRRTDRYREPRVGRDDGVGQGPHVLDVVFPRGE